MAYKYNKDTRTFEKSNDVVWTRKKIEDMFADMIDQYYWQESQNARLREENRKLKEGIWENEEISRLKEENERLKADYYRGFHISEEEEKIINEFKDNYKGQKFGAIGGAFKYEFVPTSVGTFGSVTGPDGKVLKFQDCI